MLIKLEQFVNKTTAPLSSACTFTSFGVHENVKLQPTTIEFVGQDRHLSSDGASGTSLGLVCNFNWIMMLQ